MKGAAVVFGIGAATAAGRQALQQRGDPPAERGFEGRLSREAGQFQAGLGHLERVIVGREQGVPEVAVFGRLVFGGFGAEARLGRITSGIAEAYGATGRLSYTRHYPVTVNHEAETEFAALAAETGVKLDVQTWDALRPPFPLLINATSASLAGELPPLPPELFAARPFVYDMMYGAAPTPFLREAARHGAHTADGLGMLVEQAAESFFLWRGVRPDAQAVYARLRAALAG